MDFSIDSAIERIYDSRTRDIFKEVWTSYVNRNYRSAIVMLWTTVICDLLYKLLELRDLYNDSNAESICNQILEKQKQNPKSPEWEKFLLEKVSSETKLLEPIEYENLKTIQEYRHLCAHPILGSTELLSSPNQDTVRSLIRNALESVLLKSPILSNKITDELVNDIAENESLLPNITALRKYLEAKYLKNLHTVTENYIFKALWKFVVVIENEDTKKYRHINFIALRIIYERRPTEINKYIEENKSFFSNVSNNGIEYLHYFLSYYPKIFEYLNDSARIPLKNFAHSKLNYYCIAYYLSEDKCKHLINVAQTMAIKNEISQDDTIENKTWEVLLSENEYRDLVYKIGIIHYCKSDQYSSTGMYFKRFIMPIIKELNESLLIELIEGINSNSNIYDRFYIENLHKFIKQRYLELNCSFIDPELHSNYLKSIPSDVTSPDDTVDTEVEELLF